MYIYQVKKNCLKSPLIVEILLLISKPKLTSIIFQVMEKLLEISTDYWNTFINVTDENVHQGVQQVPTLEGGTLLGGFPSSNTRRRSILTRTPLTPRWVRLSLMQPYYSIKKWQRFCIWLDLDIIWNCSFSYSRETPKNRYVFRKWGCWNLFLFDTNQDGHNIIL